MPKLAKLGPPFRCSVGARAGPTSEPQNDQTKELAARRAGPVSTSQRCGRLRPLLMLGTPCGFRQHLSGHWSRRRHPHVARFPRTRTPTIKSTSPWQLPPVGLVGASAPCTERRSALLALNSMNAQLFGHSPGPTRHQSASGRGTLAAACSTTSKRAEALCRDASISFQLSASALSVQRAQPVPTDAIAIRHSLASCHRPRCRLPRVRHVGRVWQCRAQGQGAQGTGPQPPIAPVSPQR